MGGVGRPAPTIGLAVGGVGRPAPTISMAVGAVGSPCLKFAVMQDEVGRFFSEIRCDAGRGREAIGRAASRRLNGQS